MLTIVQDLPQAPKELVLELSRRYIKLYEMITGQQFQPAALDPPPSQRMAAAVKAALQKL